MDNLIYILLAIITALSVISLIILHFIIKFLHRIKIDFLKDIQLGVNYIYNNQDKISYIYKRLKEREKKGEYTRKV